MKNRISIPSYIYKAIMALPVDPALELDYRCELMTFAVAYLFGEAESMRLSEPATAQLPFLVAMLERSKELSAVRAKSANVRWSNFAMQSNAKQCKTEIKNNCPKKKVGTILQIKQKTITKT